MPPSVSSKLLTLYCMPPSVSEKVSEMFGGVAVLAHNISHPAEFVKPPAQKTHKDSKSFRAPLISIANIRNY